MRKIGRWYLCVYDNARKSGDGRAAKVMSGTVSGRKELSRAMTDVLSYCGENDGAYLVLRKEKAFEELAPDVRGPARSFDGWVDAEAED